MTEAPDNQVSGEDAVEPHEYTVDIDVTVRLRISDPDVIARTQTQEWQEQMYTFDEHEAIAHLAWLVGYQGIALSRLDGWADCADGSVEVLSVDRW